jgi:hypothetical protein
VAKSIYIVRMEERTVVASSLFHATWDHIITKEAEIDRGLEREPDYNGSHMRVAMRVFALIGRRDYPARKELERLGCHLLVTTVLFYRKKHGMPVTKQMTDEMKDNDYWFILMWPRHEDGKVYASLVTKTSVTHSEFELPQLDRIDIWKDALILER